MYYLNYGSLASSLPTNSFDETIKNYNTILSLTENDSKFSDITALTYNNMGSAYESIGNNEKSLYYYTKSYELSKDNKDIFPSIKVVITSNLARIYEIIGKLDQSLVYERIAKKTNSAK